MENPTSILLYSKYSPNCKHITDLIQSSPISLPFKYLCIDNKEVRERIMQCSKIKIRYTPCILNLYSNGGVEQFEGPQAFDAVQSILSSLPPPIPPQNQIPSPEPIEEYEEVKSPAPKQREVKRRPAPVQRPKSKPRRREKKDEYEYKDEEIERIPIQPPMSGSTSIDDLPSDDSDSDSDSDDENERQQPIRKPKMRVRSDEGNYIEEDGEEYEPPSHNITGIRGVKETNDKNIKDGQSDIAARAQQLAKQREESDNSFKPRGVGIPQEMRRD